MKILLIILMLSYSVLSFGEEFEKIEIEGVDFGNSTTELIKAFYKEDLNNYKISKLEYNFEHFFKHQCVTDQSEEPVDISSINSSAEEACEELGMAAAPIRYYECVNQDKEITVVMSYLLSSEKACLERGAESAARYYDQTTYVCADEDGNAVPIVSSFSSAEEACGKRAELGFFERGLKEILSTMARF